MPVRKKNMEKEKYDEYTIMKEHTTPLLICITKITRADKIY